VILNKYSFGIGDRFGHQAKAQLAAIIKANKFNSQNFGTKQLSPIIPVWNKSHREHTIIGTKPSDTRRQVDEAVKSCLWDGPYFVDADHINLDNVDEFTEVCDFFTLDAASFISKPADKDQVDDFVKKNEQYLGTLKIPAINETFDITKEQLEAIANKYLFAVKEAGKIYQYIVKTKGTDKFITEVSMDETAEPQNPIEMFFILAGIAQEGIPVQTIAPKFTGRFNKGVDYVGNVDKFAQEFYEDLAVIAFAVKEFELPESLKLSIHSGSDKFSLYRPMKESMKKFDAGLHLKTAGTTWLEELTGLAMAGGDGLALVKEIYSKAFSHIDELCEPYATVIDISRTNLPSPDETKKWDERDFSQALRHDQTCPTFNPSLRQLLHVGYKIAAQMGTRFTDAVEKYEDIIAANVTNNIYERHIKPLFLG
jgi:hypothetical protein